MPRHHNSLNFRGRFLPGLFAAIALAACSDAIDGQVAANINGDEVTFAEVNAELRGMQLPEDIGEAEAQKLALERIIDRRLMAQAARNEGIDQTSYYLLRERQLRDALLAQLLREQTEQSLGAADQVEVDQFIDQNAALFANRQLLTLERIVFDAPSDRRELQPLENAGSLQEVAERLKRLDIPFDRGTIELDSLSISNDQLTSILEVSDGEPFLLPEGSQLAVAVLRDRQAAPVSGTAARPFADRIVRQRQLDRSVGELVSDLRQNAQIRYRDGLEPDDQAQPSS